MPQGIEATGIKEAIKAAKAVGDVETSKAFKTASIEAAQLVVKGARANASTRQERKAANEALDALVRGGQPAVRLSASKFPGALGAEFGADRNQRRLLKNTGGRATVVRSDATRRRVEAQTVQYDRFGAPMTVGKKARKLGATPVRVTGTILGWNQFKPWRGNDANAGYFLWPSIRENADDVRELYADLVEKLWSEG